MRAAKTKLAETERKIATMIERIIDATQPSIIAAIESRIALLDKEKHLLDERIEAGAKPRRPFEEMFQLSMRFLATPSYLWTNGDLNHKRTVLKLAFGGRLS